MSKKPITLKYKTMLEFLAFYLPKEFEEEKSSLEEITGRTLLELITMTQEDESEIWNLQNEIEGFANDCGFLYCHEHEIFHEYENCPFCSLGIKMN